MKKENGKKITIIMIVVLALVCILACFLILNPTSNNNNENNNNTNENNSSGELKELTDNSMFTIYLDGKEYVSSKVWPEGATFQYAACEDEEGVTIESAITFDESKKKVYVRDVNQTIYCYLYFTTNSTNPDPNPNPNPNPDPEPSGSAPTCSLSVTSSVVTLSKSSDATEYGLVRGSSSPNYNSISSQGLTTGEFYGFVKNAYGTGSCRVSIIPTTQGSSGSDYYTWNEAQCIKIGSNDTYNCCKSATSSGSNCPSGYSKVGSYCAKNPTDPTTCSEGTYSSGPNVCRLYASFTCPEGFEISDGECIKTTQIHQTTYSSETVCSNNCKGSCWRVLDSKEANVCFTCDPGGSLVAHIQDGKYDTFKCVSQKTDLTCPSGYIKGPYQCWKNASVSPTCGSKTNINGKCYDTTNPTSGGYSCSSSSDTLSGSQCCRTSSSQISGYSCNVTSSTPTYGWGQSTSNSGSACPKGPATCDQYNLGGKKISNCQVHSSGVYFYCSDTSYTWLNNSYCYKTYN